MSYLVRILFLLSMMTSSQSTASDDDPILIVLLAGQSNMAGVGRTEDLLNDLKSPFAEVPVWKDGWFPVEPGLVGDTDEHFGPEVTLARALHEAYPASDVRLIKHALGGQNLARRWAAGTGSRYREFRSKLDAARADLDRQGKTYVFLGLLWMQGESDAVDDPSFPAAYRANLERLIGAVRKDVHSPNLPFIMGRIATHYDSTPAGGNAIVRAAQMAVAAADPNVGCFDTDDIDMASYNPGHYSSVGQLELGRRFARALIAGVFAR